MNIAPISYTEFRKRLINELNEWFKENADSEEEEDYKLSNQSFDSEIYRTLEYATTGYGFVHSLKRVEGNDIETNFENVLFDVVDSYDSLYEDAIRGFYRVYDNKSIVLGFLFGCDSDYPMNGLIFINDEGDFCLYVPMKGNIVDSENNCPYSYHEVTDDDLTDIDPQDMIADFKMHVKL